MSFEYAPFTKGLMLGLALTSIVVGIFDFKHYFHLQLVPHLSRHHQYWRLLTHHIAFANSSDLFISEMILFNVGVQVERHFGTLKFASFAVASTMLSTLLEFSALLVFHRFGINHISSGPLPLIFSILYQYSRIIPSVYDFRVLGVSLNNKSFTYVLALQLAISHLPGSVVAAIIGLLSGQIYRSDMINLKLFRLGPSVIRFSKRFLFPLVGSTRPPRRSNRAFPDQTRSSRPETSLQNDEVVTTARPPLSSPGSVTSRLRTPGANAGLVREWVHGLTGRTEGTAAGIRVPPETEITELTAMFPDISRETIVGALQRSQNIQGAAETLLSSQS